MPKIIITESDVFSYEQEITEEQATILMQNINMYLNEKVIKQ